ncbi:DUF3072 domain-containing protein [Aestuariivirga sp.]|uniref:DUF3072 domain-containing protein n=1 Tax=Aestuariivirga sp. TaxID=2650926 RepID=UPI00391A544F
MTDENRVKPSNPKADMAAPGNMTKDPEDWVTGDEPMTGAQASYLKTLCEETGEEFDPSLTKAQASERIDALRDKDPRLNPGKEKKGRR